MEQRRLRLGDILDDYCPRERRVTNHAVVAMIEEDVKQTRCTTCDAEHVYKGGKAPRRKKADPIPPAPSTRKFSPASKNPPPVRRVTRRRNVSPKAPCSPNTWSPKTWPIPTAIPILTTADDDPRETDDDSQVHMLPPDEGPVHRPLIRAQLPRPEGSEDRAAGARVHDPAEHRTRRSRRGFRGRSQGGRRQRRRGQRRPALRPRTASRRSRIGGGRGPNQGFGRGPGGGGRQRGRSRGPAARPRPVSSGRFPASSGDRRSPTGSWKLETGNFS